MKATKFLLLTLEWASENSLKTVLLWEVPLPFTLEPELEPTSKLLEREDTPELVKERVPERQECQPKFFGLEDKEFSEDYSENIELPRKSINTNITNSTWDPRVTFTEINKFWSKPSTDTRLIKLKLMPCKTNKMPEDKRTSKKDLREQRELVKSPPEPQFKYPKNKPLRPLKKLNKMTKRPLLLKKKISPLPPRRKINQLPPLLLNKLTINPKLQLPQLPNQLIPKNKPRSD